MRAGARILIGLTAMLAACSGEAKAPAPDLGACTIITLAAEDELTARLNLLHLNGKQGTPQEVQILTAMDRVARSKAILLAAAATTEADFRSAQSEAIFARFDADHTPRILPLALSREAHECAARFE